MLLSSLVGAGQEQVERSTFGCCERSPADRAAPHGPNTQPAELQPAEQPQTSHDSSLKSELSLLIALPRSCSAIPRRARWLLGVLTCDCVI